MQTMLIAASLAGKTAMMHTPGNALSMGNGKGNPLFAAMLAQMTGNSQPLMNGVIPPALLALMPDLPVMQGAQEGSAELEDLELLLAALLQMLQQSSPETRQEILDDENLRQWMSAAEQLLAAQNIRTLVAHEDSASTGTAADLKVPADSNNLTDELMQIVKELVRMAKLHPEQPEFAALAKSFGSVVKPLLAQMEQGGENALPGKVNTPELAVTLPTDDNGLSLPASRHLFREASGKSETTVSGAQQVQPAGDHAALPKTDIVPAAGKMLAAAEQFPAKQRMETADKPVFAAKPVVQSPFEQQMFPASLADPVRVDGASQQAKAVLPQVPAQHFAEEMSRFVLKKFSVTQMNGLSEAKITLIPEHLGQLQVKIAMQNGQLTAQLMAETTVARDLLENQLPQLRAALQSQGFQVEKLEVTYHNSQLESGFFQQRDGQQPYQQFRQPERAKTAGYEQYEDSFIHELDESAAAGIPLYANGSIDVTA